VSLISICIPTCNRPALVQESVNSALAQTHRPIEIIVSDDSSNDHSEQILFDLITSGAIRYVRNSPPRKQANNINQLFELARGEFLMLLHDDDLLIPEAVALLLDCFNQVPGLTAAFGKQYLIHEDGAVDESGSKALNIAYQRTPQFAGIQVSPLSSGLNAQFPNDGFMVRSDMGRKVRYRDIPEVGDACDFDFGLRLAAIATSFYFLDRYTAKYRITQSSILTGNNYTNLTFDLIEQVSLPLELEPIRLQQMHKYAGSAVSCWLALGASREALRIYASTAYGWRRRLTLKGLAQAFLIACPPSLERWLVTQLRRLRA
jgi:glycosyltransferase involved in cell wall biosynthesis